MAITETGAATPMSSTRAVLLGALGMIVVPVAIVVAVGVGLLVGHLVHKLPDYSDCRYVGGEMCE